MESTSSDDVTCITLTATIVASVLRNALYTAPNEPFPSHVNNSYKFVGSTS